MSNTVLGVASEIFYDKIIDVVLMGMERDVNVAHVISGNAAKDPNTQMNIIIPKNIGTTFFQYFLNTIAIKGIDKTTIYNPLFLIKNTNIDMIMYAIIFLFFDKNSSVLNINSVHSIMNIGTIPANKTSFHIVTLNNAFIG